ncbi:hypothetical protein ACLB2K_035056 [Fragaria x ananassa]
MQNCPECNASRWYVNPRTNEINKGVLAKVLRYFPIIPRIQRMFLSASNSELLNSLSTHHNQDVMMRHPVDSIQWRTVDQKWPSFAFEPRNLRFGLATDGFNPYKNLSSTHSIWPVILVIYNLPPNVCMSQKNLMLSLLIPSPKQPRNDIDMYLEPLIDDLKELWSNGGGDVLPLRHNLDVMHIEKNVCKSVLATILDVNGKSKIDNESRRDLELLELMEDVPNDEKRDKLELPSAPYTLTKVKKPKFCGKLYFQRFPDGYCSNIANCVKLQQCKIQGLKSHDHHVLMQQLLSVALKGLLPEGLRKTIWRLSSFFNELCQRVLDKKRLEELEDEIVLTLCLLERYFPPSFFDIMIHLTIHIGREAKLCGPVHFRWMYPFKRYLRTIYVKNHARPEGSIAENYLADECLRFCGQYMKQVDAISSRRKRNEGVDDETIVEGSTLLKGRSVILSDSIMCEANVEGILSDTLKLLVKGPRFYAMLHIGFIIHRKRFYTVDAKVSTTDYGVHIEADSSLNYYGVIRDILVLDFYTFRLAIFRCDWANIVSGKRRMGSP